MSEPFLQDWEDSYTRNLVWTASAAIQNLDHVRPDKGLPGLIANLRSDYPALLRKLKRLMAESEGVSSFEELCNAAEAVRNEPDG